MWPIKSSEAGSFVRVGSIGFASPSQHSRAIALYPQLNMMGGHCSLNLLFRDEGQDIAEYAVMMAVIMVIVVGTIRLIGSNADNVFSQIGSSIQ
jgi:Flp pilus assembly pilin Flp